MKVGLISINSHTKVLNFASPLHTYAFQQFLFDNGVDNIIIDYEPCYRGELDIRHPYDFWVKHPKQSQKKQKEIETTWKKLYKEREIRFDKFQKFIDENYVQTGECYNQDKLDVSDVGCDIYMCVTDVIWKFNPGNGFDRGFFLACKSMEGKGKIAYAASRGAKGYTEEQTRQADEYLRSFNYISCREKSLVDFVNDETSSYAAQVLDPVFLQPASFYEKLAVEPEEQDYILIYAVMEKAGSLVEEAMKFAQEKNLAVVDISDDKTILYQSKRGERITKYDIGVEEWLGYMKNATYIFTNSFHCCCFSLIFNKEFYAGKRGGDKIDSLLALFGVENRRIRDKMKFGKSAIDYDRVNALIKEYSEKSGQFALEAIRQTGMGRSQKKIRHKWLKPFFAKSNIPGIEKKQD